MHRGKYISALLIGFLPLAYSLTCSAGLALSGYPYCANSCFTICDKYCSAEDIAKDIYCPCRHPDYVREIASCIQKACTPTDFSTIALASAKNCLETGIDITADFANSSSTSTTSGGSTASGANSPPNHTNKSKTPIGAIVGGAVGGAAVLAITVGAIIWLLRRRKKKAAEDELATRTGSSQVDPKALYSVDEGKARQYSEYSNPYSPNGYTPSGYGAELEAANASSHAHVVETGGREIPRPVYEMHTHAR